MEKLLKLAKEYCEKRNLDYDAYVEGLLSNGEIKEPVIEVLCRNLKESL